MLVGRFAEWLRWPALHFVIFGAALFILQTRVLAPVDVEQPKIVRETIIITADQAEQVRSDYRRQTGQLPSPQSERVLLDDLITEEILYREARALGLDRNDRSVMWRLAEKMRFLTESGGDSHELYRQALELGLDRDDVVVRRILIQKMRLLTKTAVSLKDVEESELREFFEQHQDDYLQPARVTLSQVFLSAERRGNTIQDDAKRLLRELQSAGDTGRPTEAGDVFPLGHEYRSSSAHHLQKIFGADFAKKVFELKPGTWSGPVPSAYGLHLVRVDKIEAAKVPPLDVVRSQVEQRLLSQRREQHLEDFLKRRRTQYEVRVESASGTQG